jgi:2-methylisocitrate lyase-like PEP mutase family enzyme
MPSDGSRAASGNVTTAADPETCSYASNSTRIPVTVDAEAGYGMEPAELVARLKE